MRIAEQIRELAERHYAPETRHIGADDYGTLIEAADVLEKQSQAISGLQGEKIELRAKAASWDMISVVIKAAVENAEAKEAG